jgi:hypothetical protein
VVCVAASPSAWYAAAALDERELSAHIDKTGQNGPLLCTALDGGNRGSVPVQKYNILALISPGGEGGLSAVDLALKRERPTSNTVIAPSPQ